jgi:hypothetical protein
MILVERLRILMFLENNNKMNTVPWDITPCNLSKLSRHFGGTGRLHEADSKIHSSSLFDLQLFHSKMKATCSSETCDDFQRTVRLYSPGNAAFHNHSRKNPKS